MTEPGATVDPTRCPLCGQDNRCARAEDPESLSCWCFAARVPPEVRAEVPDELRDRACICQRCATGQEGQTRAISGTDITALFERIRRDR